MGVVVLRMTIDPLIPAMPGRSARGVSTGQADIFLHQARSAVGCSASHTKGELHPATVRAACEADFLAYG